MAILWVQDDQALTDTGSIAMSVTWSGNTTTGNLIIVSVAFQNNTGVRVSGITDTQGNIYYPIVRRVGSQSSTIELWYAKNITGGVTPTVTSQSITSTGGGQRTVMTINEFSGLDQTQPLDLAAGAAINPASTKYAANTPYSTRAANELVFVAAHSGTAGGAATFSLGAGYSNLQTQAATNVGCGGVESQVLSAQAITSGPITLSTSAVGTVVMATFADITMPPFTYLDKTFYRGIRPHPFSPGLAR